jgi:L-asparagine oxygenase
MLGDFARDPGPSGALLIEGLPIDDRLPPTPLDGRRSPLKTSRMSESLLVVLGSLLGSVLGYREEKEGMLIHDVCPQPGREERQENSGSEYFDIHTENAFHPFRPDHLLLLCLRGDAEGSARTLVAPARAALSLMSERDVEILRRPLFRHRMPTSFAVDGGEPGLSSLAPVLTGENDDVRLRVDAFNTVTDDGEGLGAVEHLLDALRRVLTGPALTSGDMLVVDNRRAAHARTAFTPRYDGSDRWLQRAFTVTHLPPGLRHGSHVYALSA